MHIEFDQRLTKDEFRAPGRTARRAFLVTAVTLFFADGCLWVILHALNAGPRATSFVTSFFFAAASVRTSLTTFVGRLGKKKALATTHRIRIDEAGISAESDESRTWLAWSLFIAVLESRGVFLLRLYNGTHVVVPVRCLADDAEMFRGFLQDRFPKRS